MDKPTHQTTIYSIWEKLPVYFEKNSSIVATQPTGCSLSTKDVVHMIVRSLTKSQEKDLSFMLKESGNSIRLSAINQLSCRIHFFSDNDKGIIEFQRRFGCVVQFCHFYTEVKSILMNDYPDIFSVAFNTVAKPLLKPFPFSFLQENVFKKVSFENAKYEFTPPVASTMKCCSPCLVPVPPSTPTSVFRFKEKNNFKELYYNLIDLSQTKYIDVSTQGLSGLASIIDDIKAKLVPVHETENFVKILNDLFQTGELSQMEYIARILFVLSDDIQVKQAVKRLKESGKVDICETLRICLKNILVTYMNAVLEKRLQLIVSNFSR